jgi:hypothetical protein
MQEGKVSKSKKMKDYVVEFNPSLKYTDHFVFSTFRAKRPSLGTFILAKHKTTNLEGSEAFCQKTPR